MKENNKKRLVALAVLAAVTVPTVAAAQANMAQINVRYGIQVNVNGIPQRLTDANGREVRPFEYNGTTYVPIRGVAESLHAVVDYDPKTDSVSITHGFSAPITSGVPSDRVALLDAAHTYCEAYARMVDIETQITLMASFFLAGQVELGDQTNSIILGRFSELDRTMDSMMEKMKPVNGTPDQTLQYAYKLLEQTQFLSESFENASTARNYIYFAGVYNDAPSFQRGNELLTDAIESTNIGHANVLNLYNEILAYCNA